MKKKALIAVIAVCLIAAAVIVSVCVGRNGSKTVLSKSYDEDKINGVELSDSLSAVVDSDDLYKVKMAVLENNISSENEEKLAPLIEEYGVESTLSGYSYLNDSFVTWDTLEEFVKDIDRSGIRKAMEAYEEAAAEYTPSRFKKSRLEEWINVKGYPAADITALDKLAQLYGQDFDELMERYENGVSIGELKSELGLVNTSSEVEYVTINESDVRILAEKCSMDEGRAEEVLTKLVRLNFDAEKIGELEVSDEYELMAMVMEEKYGGDN